MVRIAIPEPTSTDAEYNGRSLQPYLNSLQAAGAEPLLIRLNEPHTRVAQLLSGVEGILLPGSRYDVDPQRYGEARQPECGEADPARTAVDEVFLQDAFNLRKPVLAICHGLQTLNVWRNGTLIQDLKTPVNHRPGREVVEAHPVQLAPGSRLANIVPKNEETSVGRALKGHDRRTHPVSGSRAETESEYSGASAPEASLSTAVEVQVNSSHHQAVREPGDKLRVVAISPADGVIEAVEIDSPDHFVVGVQWHPERTYGQHPLSRALFACFVDAARVWRPPVTK